MKLCEVQEYKRNEYVTTAINWPAPEVWVFIGQMVVQCSRNAENTGSYPVEVPKAFFPGYFAIA